MIIQAETVDLLIVGAGPCGVAAGAAAKKAGLSCVLLDKGAIAGSLLNYPYYMTFFSTAVMLEVGDVPFTIPEPKPTRREALTYYRRVVTFWDLDVRQYEEVTKVERAEGGFLVSSEDVAGARRAYQANNLVIATGGFYEPNFLEVPGENLPKVKHYYHEPYPFFDQDVVVVGAGNSAVESALEMYRNGVRVTLVHFGAKIDRGVKPWVVPDITNRLEKGEITPLLQHRLVKIEPRSVTVRSEVDGSETELANDWVVAMTGWRPNPVLLRALGVSINEETGIPEHSPKTMETNQPGVFIAGVIAAGHNANKIFIENGREHGTLIVNAIGH